MAGSFLRNRICLCVCSPGHSFWWDLGAGGAGARDGDGAHGERGRAGGRHPWDLPLLQHVSLLQGGLMCLQLWPWDILALRKERGRGKGCFSLQLVEPHVTL